MRNTCCSSAGSTFALIADIFLCVQRDFAICGFSRVELVATYEGSIMKFIDAIAMNESIMRIVQRRKHSSLMRIGALTSLSEDALS